jgi:outer membrane protein OmpU
MRKSLLATTAIVGASMLGAAAAEASDPPVLRFDGFMRFEAKIINQDVKVGRERGLHFESDDAGFNMNADATADNGLKYAVKIEIDTDAAAAGIDETRIRFSGDWGILDLGDDDSAGDSMAYGGENVFTAGSGYDGGAGSAFNFIGARKASPNLGTGGADTGDASKITYYTPRFSGFQLGVSYTPDSGNNLASNISSGDTTDLVNVVEAGVNYVEKFGDVDFRVHLTGGVGEYDAASNDGSVEDAGGYMVGLGLGWNGWKLALGYGDAGDGLQAKGGIQDNGEWFSSGLGYSMDQYTFALGYFHGEATGALGEEDTDFVTVQAQYNMAPGLEVYAEVDWINVNNPSSGLTSTDGETMLTENDGVLFLLGTKVSF